MLEMVWELSVCLAAGAIQDWQGVTANLTNLYLSGNDFEGTLAAHLPALQNFDASDNPRLSGYAIHALCCKPWQVVFLVWVTAKTAELTVTQQAPSRIKHNNSMNSCQAGNSCQPCSARTTCACLQHLHYAPLIREASTCPQNPADSICTATGLWTTTSTASACNEHADSNAGCWSLVNERETAKLSALTSFIHFMPSSSLSASATTACWISCGVEACNISSRHASSSEFCQCRTLTSTWAVPEPPRGHMQQL